MASTTRNPAAVEANRVSNSICVAAIGSEVNLTSRTLQVARIRKRLNLSDATASTVAFLAYGEVRS